MENCIVTQSRSFFFFFHNDKLQLVFTQDNVTLDWSASVPPLAIAFEIM